MSSGEPNAADQAPATSEGENAPSVTPMRTSHVLRLAVVGIVVLVGLLILGIVPRRSLQNQLAAKADTATRALVVVAAVKVERASSPQTLSLPGTIEALHEVALFARVPGYVQHWHADIGTPVRAGQLLAELVAPELDQNVLQARAQLSEAQAVLALARSNYERYRYLFADSAVTAQEYQQMKVAYDSAAAAVRAAQANLGAFLTMQGYKKIRAPFNGVVTARNVDYGALVGTTGGSTTPLTAGGTQLTPPATMPAASLFRVAQTDTLRVYINVPEPDVRSIYPGLPAQLVIADLNDRTVEGTIVRTAHAVDLQTRTLLVEINVPNRERLLLPGMYAQLRLSLKRTGAPLLVPSTALINRSAGPQVTELTPTDSNTATVHARSVVVGRDYGGTLEITSGISVGALVATNGAQIFTDGQAVRFTATPGPTSPTAQPSSPAAAPKASKSPPR